MYIKSAHCIECLWGLNNVSHHVMESRFQNPVKDYCWRGVASKTTKLCKKNIKLAS